MDNSRLEVRNSRTRDVTLTLRYVNVTWSYVETRSRGAAQTSTLFANRVHGRGAEQQVARLKGGMDLPGIRDIDAHT